VLDGGITNAAEHYKCRRTLQMLPNITNAAEHYKCRRTLQMPPNITNAAEHYKCRRTRFAETFGFYRYLIPMGLFLERIFFDIIIPFLTPHLTG